MVTPTFSCQPQRGGRCSDAPTVLDLLLQIHTPDRPAGPQRPPLNLGFVLDRSGSMEGAKIRYAIEAVTYGIGQLLPSDRLSVTIYDDQIDLLIPSTPVTQPQHLIRQLQAITPRNMTNLHGGWEMGFHQVKAHHQTSALNRVILLSDGLANMGKTNNDAIASDVHHALGQGVSTTTMGVGDDYNEDLMTGMAQAGQGNYYYIDSPDQLPTIFQGELQGLIATLGRQVKLRIEPQGDTEILEVFNDFPLTSQGEYVLPDLIHGRSFAIALRLQIPPHLEGSCCAFRLTWIDQETGQPEKLRIALDLPAMVQSQWQALAPDGEVDRQVAQLQAARLKRQAVAHFDRGDLAGVQQILQNAQGIVAAAPPSPAMAVEMAALEELMDDLQEDGRVFRKSSLYQAHNVSQSSNQAGYAETQQKFIQRRRQRKGRSVPPSS